MTDESNFTMIGNRPTLENWELLKLNYACSACICNMSCILFPWYISENLCCRSAILIDQCWKSRSYSVKLCLLHLNAICPADFFLWYISENLCHRSAILHWQLPLCSSCLPTRKATGCKILLRGIYTKPGVFALTRKKFAFEIYKCS